MRFSLLGPTLAVAILSNACAGFHSLEVAALDVSSEPPSNVALHLAVDDGDAPVIGLTAENFTLYENEKPLSASESQQVLLERTSGAFYHTLLLVDVSEATPAELRSELKSAVEIFVQRVRRTQSVSVYVFDGGPSIRPLTELSREMRPSRPANVAAPRPKDKSRNLNGGVVQALDQLKAQLAQSGAPLTAGTLVVFAGGADLAGRVSSSAVEERTASTPDAIVSIGIGEDVAELKAIAKNGYVDAHSKDTISLAFEDAAHRVTSLYERHYVLSYCSPARAAHRTLRVEVHAPDGHGGEHTGSASTEFDASNFQPGCDPNKPPHFHGRKRSP